MSAATDAPTVAVSGEASAERNADETLIEEPPEDDEQAGPPVRYKIVSYCADYTVDGYLKRFDRGDLSIPKFQRGFIWTAPQASRLIESLILDLPVPGVFLFREPKTRKLIVVDGQQRLLSLRCFREEEIRGKRLRLSGVSDEQLCGKTYSALDETDRRAFEDAIIHATIFQQSEPTDDRSSVYQVFERLNTGGTALVDQEVRACVYRGRFNELLGELNREPHWRDLFGQVQGERKMRN